MPLPSSEILLGLRGYSGHVLSPSLLTSIPLYCHPGLGSKEIALPFENSALKIAPSYSEQGELRLLL
jgi:hypothetical protein